MKVAYSATESENDDIQVVLISKIQHFYYSPFSPYMALMPYVTKMRQTIMQRVFCPNAIYTLLKPYFPFFVK